MDDDLWGSPTGADVEDDGRYVQTVRGCEFYFDRRLDAIEENALNDISCMQVLKILTEKEDVELSKRDKVLVMLRNDDKCCDKENVHNGNVQDAHADSKQSVLDEEANTSNLSDAETVETRDSSNAIEDMNPETGPELHEIAENDSETVQPTEDVDISSIDASIEPFTGEGSISSSSESTIKNEEAGEDSCLSMAANKMLYLVKHEDTAELLKPKTTAENSAGNIGRDEEIRHLNEMQQSGNSNLKPSSLGKPCEHHCSAANKSKYGSPSLRHLVSKAREKLSEKTNGPAEKTNPTNLAAEEDEGRRKDHHQTDNFQDVLTANEPFTMDCLLEMCDGDGEGSEAPHGKKQKRSQPEAGHAARRFDRCSEVIKNLVLKPARQKPGSKTLLALPSMQNPGCNTIERTQQKSSSNHASPNKSYIRNTKQNLTPEEQGELGELDAADPGDEQKPRKKRKNSTTQSMPRGIGGSIVPLLSSDPPWDPKNTTSKSSAQIMSDSEISSEELKDMKTNDLRAIAKALKVTHYYKLKKNDLLQQLTNRLSPS